MINKPIFFTKHQLKRMSKRGISKKIVFDVIEKGEWRSGNNPFSYEVEYKGFIVILYEMREQLNISTCKLNREYTLEAEILRDKEGISFWKAVHKIVKSIDL